MWPCSSTTIRPAWRIVERRWAITIAVRPAKQPPQPLLDARLGVQVDVRGGLVEDEDARVGDQRAGERDQLALPGRELCAALADFRVVAVRQLGDELLGSDRRRGLADLLGARAGPPEGDVLGDRAREQERLLRHDPHLRAQRAARDLAQVVAVDEHAARGRVVEARDELGHRRLAGAGRADERHGLARRDRQVDVLERQDRSPVVLLAAAAGVGEGDVVEDDLAADPLQLERVAAGR